MTILLFRFKKILLAGMAAGWCTVAFAQITGGQQVFQFMMLPASSRISAMGGAQIAVRDDDVSFAAANPAALNPTMSGRLTFQHSFYLADLQTGYAAGAWQLPKSRFTLHGGVQYMKYGEIKRANEYGDITGTIPTAESAITLGAARPLTDRLSLGLNLRVGFSTLDAYKASALASDVGMMYADTARNITIGIVARNVGTQMGTYFDTREDLPYNLQVGFTKRLKHLPFRIGVIAQHLQQWNIRYDDPNAVQEEFLSFDGSEPESKKGNAAIDNFFRHFIFNGEFLLGRNEVFRIRFGYNHLRKRELSVQNYRSLAGFSGGLGVKINRFRIDAGYATYHLGGSNMHIGIGTNLNDFF
jgi:hypothetical protein